MQIFKFEFWLFLFSSAKSKETDLLDAIEICFRTSPQINPLFAWKYITNGGKQRDKKWCYFYYV